MSRKAFLLVFVLVVALATVLAPSTALAGRFIPVLSGDVPISYPISYPLGVEIAAGAHIYNPNGSLTMTVDGVETGQKLATTAGTATVFAPGTYRRWVVFTPTRSQNVEYLGLTFPFRQALYVANGPDWSRSVSAALSGGSVTTAYAKNVKIRSTGECFNGVYAARGEYLLKGLDIALDGNGRCDFIGYGAGVLADGKDVRLTVDSATITSHGVARTAIAVNNGASLVVKNSTIKTSDGILPADYVPTIFPSQMREVPWVLGLSGNARATNLLGQYTKASYINSSITSEGWGALSTDGAWRTTLTAIDSTISNTGGDGYGSLAIGSATQTFLGCKFDVSTYGTIAFGSFLHYGDSTNKAVSKLNTDLSLGLTDAELKSIETTNTVVKSKRFGIMWASGGRVDIDGATIFDTGETTFLDKGQVADVTVDGSNGAKLLPANGVIFQLMDSDDPGADPVTQLTNHISVEKTTPVMQTHDPHVYAAPSYSEGIGPFGPAGIWTGDARITLSQITVAGDFFNSARGDIVPGFPPGSQAYPINLGVFCKKATVTGRISSSTAVHRQSTIVYPRFFFPGDVFGSTAVAIPDDYKQLGEVTNTPSKAVNNGVLVTLEHSRWVVTGTSWLTGITLDNDSSIEAPAGSSVIMYVNGTKTAIEAGRSYTGDIELVVGPTV